MRESNNIGATAFSPLRFRLYAKDLSNAILQLRDETLEHRRDEMGISDYLRAKLSSFPGIDEATSELVDGQQIVRIGGGWARVGPFASDNEIERAIRKILNMPDTEANPLLPMPALVEPEKDPAPPAAPVGKPIPSSGGYTPGSLKNLLQGLRDRQASVMSDVHDKAKEAHKALDLASRVGADLKATADSILSELGQFSNHPDEE